MNEVKRCDEMERKIRYFADQVHKMKIELPIDAEKFENEDSLKLDDLEVRVRLCVCSPSSRRLPHGCLWPLVPSLTQFWFPVLVRVRVCAGLV